MMLLSRLFLALILLLPAIGEAQHRVRVVKPVKKAKPESTRLSIGAGITESVLFLARNTREDNEAKGINLNLSYGITRLLRANVEVTRYFPIDIAPTWYDIKAYTVEANMHF